MSRDQNNVILSFARFPDFVHFLLCFDFWLKQLNFFHKSFFLLKKLRRNYITYQRALLN